MRGQCDCHPDCQCSEQKPQDYTIELFEAAVDVVELMDSTTKQDSGAYLAIQRLEAVIAKKPNQGVAKMDRDEYERMSPVELQLRFYELRSQIAALETEQTWIVEESLVRIERGARP